MADGAKVVERAIKQVSAQKIKQGQAPKFTVEDIRPILEKEGLEPGQFGPFIGALAREGIIRRTGDTLNSSIPESKGRLLQVYESTAQALHQWGLEPPAASTPSATLPVPFIDGVRRLTGSLRAKGFVVEDSMLANLLLCARVKPFIFLYGPTGTGKSRLPELLAEELGGDFEIVPVKPNWSDSSELIGYYSVTKDDYVTGALLRTLDAAIDKPTQIHVFVLDEMNLARVEHYFSELLSVMESRRRTPEGVRTRPIPLENLPRETDDSPKTPGLLEEYERLSRLYLPANLIIVGTVNIDETTFNFSPKVLDRGFPVEMVPGVLESFPADSGGVHSSLPPEFALYLFDPPDRTTVPLNVVEARQWAQADKARLDLWVRVLTELNRLNAALRLGGFDITYRTRDAICLYIDGWYVLKSEELLSFDKAFDFCILQKILPKLRGNRSSHYQTLEQLWQLLTGGNADRDPLDLAVSSGARFPMSADKVLDMMRQYADGSFSFWLTE